MNKSQLIEKLANNNKDDIQLAERIVNIFFNNIKDSLSNENKVEIRGFGSFNLKYYKGYTGRNPKTGENVIVNSKKLPIFRTGKDLKDRVDNVK